MTNINKINTINSYYLPAFRQKSEENTNISNPIKNNASLNGVDALANYNLATQVNSNENPMYLKWTLDEHLSNLNKKGVNYNLEENGPDRIWLELKDKYGNVTDRIEYIDGKVAGCTISTYKDGQLIKRIDRNKDRIVLAEKMYYRDKYPQENFTVHGINHETTPEKFIEYLKSNNIKYNVEYSGEEDNNRSVTLTEYDENGKAVREYWWYYGECSFDEQFPWVSVSELNEDEEEVRRILFDKDVTEVCDYNYLTKYKDYNNTEIDVKTLTEAGITYNTTPDEYIKYLNEKGILYKIKEYPELSKDIEIVEYDEKGETTNSTEWIYEQDSPALERICRCEISEQGHKSFDFYPDITETMNLRYID